MGCHLSYGYKVHGECQSFQLSCKRRNLNVICFIFKQEN